MTSSNKRHKGLSPLAALLLVVALVTGQTAASVHLASPPAAPDHAPAEHTDHHHHDHSAALSAPSGDHGRHHGAEGGVECPCLLCAGGAGDALVASLMTASGAGVPLPRAQTVAGAVTSPHVLPHSRGPPRFL